MLGDFEKSALRKFLDFNCGNVWRIRSEKVQKVILWAKNSVWRRLRRARAKNTLKTRFWKVIFGQNPPTKIIFVCWAKTLKKTLVRNSLHASEAQHRVCFSIRHRSKSPVVSVRTFGLKWVILKVLDRFERILALLECYFGQKTPNEFDLWTGRALIAKFYSKECWKAGSVTQKVSPFAPKAHY